MKKEQPDADYYTSPKYQIRETQKVKSVFPCIKVKTKKKTKWAICGPVDEKWERRKKELAEMPYAEYLETPEWKERRLKHFKTAGFRCQLCNAQDFVLHVHHRTYKDRGDEKFFDLIVLCENCHHLFHEEMEIIP